MTSNGDVKGILGYITEPVRNEIVSVGVASVRIADQRVAVQKRKIILIRNTSSLATQTITVNLGAQPAVANQGIVLQQNESFVDSTSEGYECYQGVITAISAVAAAQVSIMER